MKKPTSEQWEQIMDSIKEKENQQVEIPNEFGEYMCDYFTNVLPPITWGRTYVLCSEPYLIASKEEIEEAKYRVKLKREIRKSLPRSSWFSIRNLPTNILEKLV